MMIEITNILDVEKYIEGLDAVIFDLDDTLYSEKQYVRSGYKKIAEHFSILAMEDEMWTVFKSGGRAVDVVLEKYGLEECKDKALQTYRFQEPEICLYPGVRGMIERIRREYKAGIITDGRPEGQRAKIRALGLDVDEVIITDELGSIECRKPNPIAFEKMAGRLGTEFGVMCYVGDNIEKDFVAPEKLGMRCIWFRNPDGIYYRNN